MERPELTNELLLKAIEETTVAVGRMVDKHGLGAYISNHEALGIITEEYQELVDAVRSNDPVDIANEILDIAAACVKSIASMLDREARIVAAREELEKGLDDLQKEVLTTA